MNGYCSILILLFITGYSFGQEEYNSKTFKKSLDKYERKMVKNSEECKEGLKEAVKDFQKGKVKFFSIGDLDDWQVVYDLSLIHI